MQKTFLRLITDKINPGFIIKRHLDTFRDGFGKPHWQDYFTFFILPMVPALIFKYLGAVLDTNMVDIINTSLALFAGLFLSVSIQLIGIDKSKFVSDAAKRVRSATISNISFIILLSLITIILSYFSLFEGVKYDFIKIPFIYYKNVIDILVYWLMGIFMLTVLMILKRTAVLFDFLNQ